MFAFISYIIYMRYQSTWYWRRSRYYTDSTKTDTFYFMQYYTVLCSIMQYYAVLCSIMQYYAVLCSIMQPYSSIGRLRCVMGRLYRSVITRSSAQSVSNGSPTDCASVPELWLFLSGVSHLSNGRMS